MNSYPEVYCPSCLAENVRRSRRLNRWFCLLSVGLRCRECGAGFYVPRRLFRGPPLAVPRARGPSVPCQERRRRTPLLPPPGARTVSAARERHEYHLVAGRIVRQTLGNSVGIRRWLRGIQMATLIAVIDPSPEWFSVRCGPAATDELVASAVRMHLETLRSTGTTTSPTRTLERMHFGGMALPIRPVGR